MSRLAVEIIERNLRLLSSEWAPIAEKIQQEQNNKEARLIPSEEGGLGCRLINGVSEAWVHSSSNPIQEALLPLENFNPTENALVIIWQSGLGYMASELRNRRREGKTHFRLIVVETRNTAFRASLQVTDYYGLFNSRSTYFFAGSRSESDLMEFLKRYPWLLRDEVIVMPGSQFGDSDRELARIHNQIEELRRDSYRKIEALKQKTLNVSTIPHTVISAGLHPSHAEVLCEAFQSRHWTVSKRLEQSSVTRFIEDPESYLNVCEKGLPKLVLSFGGKSDLSLEDLRQLKKRNVKTAAWFYDNPFRFPISDEELSLISAVFVFDSYYENYFKKRGVPSCQTIPAAIGIVSHERTPPETYRENITFLGSTGIERVTFYSNNCPFESKKLSNLPKDIMDGLLEADGAKRHRYMEEIIEYDGSMHAMVKLLLLEEYIGYRLRIKFLSAIADLPLGIYGDQHWANQQAVGSLSTCFRGRGTHYPDETVDLYRTSKININIFHAQCVDSATTRIYDTLAVGGFVLSEYRPVLDREFKIGKDLDVFQTPEELREKVEYYLENDDQRRQIALHGQATVHEFAIYERRVDKILEYMELT